MGDPPVVVEPIDGTLPEVLRSCGQNLGRAWEWIDRARACLRAMEAR